MTESKIECVSCYEEFDRRAEHPDLRVCERCYPNLKDLPEYCCPKCGWDATTLTGDEDDPVVYSSQRHNIYLEMQYGGPCEEWTETWTCPECSNVFSFDNGSC